MINLNKEQFVSFSKNIKMSFLALSPFKKNIKMFFLVLSLCLSANFANASTVLKAVMHSDLRVVDPILTSAHITLNHAFLIYDVLIAKDSKGQPRPQMADWKVSDDGLIYTFTLRDGLKFHDGAPVTSKDVVASLKRWGGRDDGGILIFDSTESLVASDVKTIVWKLKAPFYPFLDILSKDFSSPAFIMPERIAKTPSNEAIKEYIGSGPFKFITSEFKLGIGAVYEKFTDYIPRNEPADGMAGGKVVNIDRVEWVTMTDEQTAFNALVNGEVDYLENISIDLLPLLEGNKDVIIDKRENFKYQAMTQTNFNFPPFDNQKIRQAAFYALSQQPILSSLAVSSEFYTPCGAIFGCDMPLATDIGTKDIVKNGNIEKAKALLKEAGYDGTPIIVLQPNTTIGRMTVVAAQQLRQVGFNVELEPVDMQTYLIRQANVNSSKKDGWSMFFASVLVSEISSPLSSPMLDGIENTGWPFDAKVKELKAKFIAAKNQVEQKAIAEQIQARVIDVVLYIPLGEYLKPQAYSAKVSNVLNANVPVFWNMKKQ